MEEKKPVYKKWWFWLILVVSFVTIILVIDKIEQEKKLKKTMENIGKGASDFLAGIENAESHLDEFSYNYTTGEVDYNSKITLEGYNRINEGMTQEDVVKILGEQENILDGENTYILEWGNSYKPVTGGYWIQIVFDKNERVLNKYQTGLK